MYSTPNPRVNELDFALNSARDQVHLGYQVVAIRNQQLALRMRRQAVLDQPRPPQVRMVLGESVLWMQVGGPAVMRAQLLRLADLAAGPDLTLQVLPLRTAAHAQPAGPFTLLEFADPADPTVVYLEHLTGSLLLEEEDEVQRYRAMFDHLRAAALGPGPSADLIARTAAGLA